VASTCGVGDWTQVQAAKAEVVAAVSVWLNCEDDPELLDAEAEAAEEEMENLALCQGADVMSINKMEEEEVEEDCQAPPPAITS
jgi:hypothetical protein